MLAYSLKASFSFIMSLHSSICPLVSAWLTLAGNLRLGTSLKICEENPDLVKTGQYIGQFT
jgi:hypothetical protein